MAAGSGYDSSSGVYRSPRPPVPFPADPDLSMAAFLFRSAAAHPDRLVLADAVTGETLTFSALRLAVSSLPLSKSHVALFLAPNSLPFAVSFLSVLSLGAVATTANSLYTPSELSSQFLHSRPRLLITVSSLLHKTSSLPPIPVLLLDSPDSPVSTTIRSIFKYSDLINLPNSPQFTPPPIRQSDTAALLYSSGTTGVSKGVVLTHVNFISAALMVAANQDTCGEGGNTFLCFLPMFHVFGLSVIVYAQLRRGNSVVVMPRFEMELALRSIERYRVGYLWAVPPVVIALAKRGRVEQYDLSLLRWLGSGAAPLGKDVMEEVANVLPQAQIIQGYGLTESCGIISLEFPKGET